MPLPAFGRQPMKSGTQKSGFTLIEMLVVIAIIIVLISVMAGVGKRINDQGKERLCRTTIELVGNALEQFRDFGYEYKDANYTGLVFPLDCNGFTVSDLYLQQTLRNALYPPAPPITTVDVNQNEPVHDISYSGSEVLYFCLSQVPDCRTTLEKIDKSLLTNKGTNGNSIDITITSGAIATKLPFTRIIDPWGTTLRYDYYPEYADYILANPSENWSDYLVYRNSAKKTFPVITSAGPDKVFDTKDDVSNIQQK